MDSAWSCLLSYGKSLKAGSAAAMISAKDQWSNEQAVFGRWSRASIGAAPAGTHPMSNVPHQLFCKSDADDFSVDSSKDWFSSKGWMAGDPFFIFV